MSFDDLPVQQPMFPQADDYGLASLRQGKEALSEVWATQDIAYGGDYWQKLDVFAPMEKSTGLPVVLFFHGGGWTHGYKEWCGFMAPALTQAPAIFVSASYRLIPATDYDGVLSDARAALAWVHTNIAAYGGDPDRIWVGGHSAGGQIAALLALDHAVGDNGGQVQGCFPISGTFGKDSVMPKNASGEVVATVPIVPPLSLVKASTVPFYIIWGGLEDQKIKSWGHEMASALKATGTHVQADEYGGEDHFTIHLNTGNPADTWTATVREWIAKKPTNGIAS